MMDKVAKSIQGTWMNKTEMMEFCQFCANHDEPISAEAVLSVLHEIDIVADACTL